MAPPFQQQQIGDGEAFTLPVRQVFFHKMGYKIAQIRLVSSHPEVYEPCDDSFALVDALLADRSNLIQHKPKLCMEVGCGSGYVITSLALLLGQESSSGFSFLPLIQTLMQFLLPDWKKRLAGLVDVIVVNPPYSVVKELPLLGLEEDGRRVIDRILPVADLLLSEKGWLYMVTLASNFPLKICLEMRQKGYASRIVLQRSTDEESLHIIKFWRESDKHDSVIVVIA
ncbi:hypothetical protein G4B88_015889 [Cannabis sativa]|uniref:Methyltransferase small domain-containing protein n=1 Tax=Cannabis sativa TaxID=3483 RepID=A0A7J6G633_CANSA|nr:hypothetical protein G4B88_015889 [Cannabis sativa]